MDAVALALVSAAFFGAMPVAVRFALVPPVVPAAVGALFMQVATFAVLCVAAAIQGGVRLHDILPFVLAGAIAPGLSNLFITVGIREAGSSRASVAFGTAPLFAITLAVLVFGERPGPAVLVGAFLIVAGGVALALESERPAHVRAIGIAYALVGAALFALRDNLVRELSLDTDVPSMTAGVLMLASGIAVTSTVVVVRHHRVRWAVPVVARWLLPGAMVGLSYVALFEAFYRGTVSVVAPIVATESLFGVAFSAVLLHRVERVGPRLVAGAALVVTGGVLIGVFRYSPSRCAAAEVVLLQQEGHLLAGRRPLHVGGAEMDPAPGPCVHDLLQRRAEALEVPWLVGETAGVDVERDLVLAEELAGTSAATAPLTSRDPPGGR